MTTKKIHIGDGFLHAEPKECKGTYVHRSGEKWYRISNADTMEPFLMSIVSSGDHWMYISSNGSLTAGRRNADNALFPYTTVDKIHESNHSCGSKTYIKIEKDKELYYWEPFSFCSQSNYHTQFNLYKNLPGNKVLFEAINHSLGIIFSYSWTFSEKFGFVKQSSIENTNGSDVHIELLDGMSNILPYGVNQHLQTNYSNLVDAYKKAELDEESKMGIFRLSSIPVDRAEPSEALAATTVWCKGLENSKFLISENQVSQFISKGIENNEYDVRGQKGAYFVYSKFGLQPRKPLNWVLCAELEQNSASLFDLKHWLQSDKNQLSELENDIAASSERLIHKVAEADGLQLCNEELAANRHFSNVLYNMMRGGTFSHQYHFPKKDFINFVQQCNKAVHKKHIEYLATLPDSIHYQDLIHEAGQRGDDQFLRICYEYLPLSYGRRHGDPSRPWNSFAINLKNSDGSERFDYQGNWRDIFQNWEALAYSYPKYIFGMLVRFLNATTADGYNPYRIGRFGIDWEAPEPGNPWAYIGYWNDHQIVYLSKLLEFAHHVFPEEFDEWMSRNIFSFANVPYRIKSFDELIADPFNTIVFDNDLNEQILERVHETGSDARLLCNSEGHVIHASFAEKVLILILAKMANYIHEGGIWLNTQRPEWNDANNALVGNGASMISIYHLRRLVSFLSKVFHKQESSSFNLSAETYEWFTSTYTVLMASHSNLEKDSGPGFRWVLLEHLGIIADKYRKQIYNQGFAGQAQSTTGKSIAVFMNTVLDYIDHSIKENKRSDGMFHSYNLIHFKQNKGIEIERLYEMLEGQVSVISSGALSVKENLEVLNALRASKMFSPQQYSYLLYPDRKLKRFTEKNTFSKEILQKSNLLKELIRNKNFALIQCDAFGNYHFNSIFTNKRILQNKLREIIGDYIKEKDDQLREEEIVLSIYEDLFEHKKFTGRSGTFFAYEGLGSIYWHMVSKLLLAVQEAIVTGEKKNKETLGKLIEHYFEIRAGIGFNKEPSVYGAFPSDAYSHTPAGKGAKQPGMTGQVKEDIIARFGELGIRFKDNTLSFDSLLLREMEFIEKPATFSYFNSEGKKQQIDLPAGSLAFTLCNTPLIYTKSKNEKMIIHYKTGNREEINELKLNKNAKAMLLNRDGAIRYIHIYVEPKI